MSSQTIDLNFHSWGEADKPALLLLHGFMGSGADWVTVAEAFATDFYVIAPDLPGHGRSLHDAPEAFAMPQAAASVVALLDKLKIASATLLGYSMGGRLALYLAVHFAQRVNRLVLESSSPGLADSAEITKRQIWDAKIADRLTTEPFPAFLDSWYAMGLFESFRQHRNYEQALASRLKNDPAQLALSMRMMGTGSQPSLWDAWADVAIETLLIVGELDAKYVGISAEMHHLNPNATRIILPTLGHNTHFEDPQTFVATLRKWLASAT